MESIPEKDLEDKLYTYLKENQRSAFTIGALLERLEEIVLDHDFKNYELKMVRKYGRKNIQIILEKLRDNARIKSIPHQKETYYWFSDPEYPLRTPVNFVSASKSSWKTMAISGRVAVVTAIIGLMSIIAGGLMMSFIPGSPMIPTSLTFIIVGVIVLLISLMIATSRSKCWECCGAC